MLGRGVDADSQTFPVGTPGMLLEVEKIHAHPFLAEYDFTFTLKDGPQELGSMKISDTGGYSRIDVLKVDPSTYAFEHLGDTTCMNIAEKRFESCFIQTAGRRIGYFDFDTARNWRFIPDFGGRN